MDSRLKQKSKYAYVALVMIDPKFVIGAITLAQSLKKTNTLYDIVCMVSTDITGEPFDILLEHFTYVIKVEYVQIETKEIKSEKRKAIYDSWIDKSYTKFSAMLLDQYEKVCLLDSDMLVINNIDHLFELQTPVGVFSNHWFDKVIPKEFNKKSCNYYMNFSTYDMISPHLIHKALTKNGFVASGNLMVLTPNKHEFKEIVKFIKDLQPFGFNCASGGDEQSICYYQSIIRKRPWTCLKQPYNVIPWKIKETLLPNQKPYIMHYNMTPKPWGVVRSKWLDTEIWWAYANSITKSDGLDSGTIYIEKICNKLDITYLNFKFQYCPYCYILAEELNHHLFDCKRLYLD